MRKLRPNSEESLDLLLDTLCNVFGGIILISCLLALLTQHSNTIAKSDADASGLKGRLLAERHEAAANELAALKQLADKLAATGQGELQKLADERDQLRATQERLRRQASISPVDDNSTKDPVGEVTVLRSKVNALDLQIADAKARRQAATSKEQDLAARTQRVRSQINEKEAKRDEYVRFPKEKTTSKHAFNFILKYGDVYPLVDANGKTFDGITHEPLEDKAFIANPIRSEGLAIARDINAILELLAICKKMGVYISIYVYPDSFETFRTLKKHIFNAGLEYGFEVEPEHYKIRFGPNGSSPAPL